VQTISTGTKTYDVDFAWAPTFDGGCMIQMNDQRRIPEIAAEFDGIEKIHCVDDGAGQEYDWEGYSRLKSITSNNGKVQITLAKEV